MKIKNEKLQLSKVLADVSLKIGKISADSACAYIFHQPKMPAELNLSDKISMQFCFYFL